MYYALGNFSFLIRKMASRSKTTLLRSLGHADDFPPRIPEGCISSIRIPKQNLLCPTCLIRKMASRLATALLRILGHADQCHLHPQQQLTIMPFLPTSITTQVLRYYQFDPYGWILLVYLSRAYIPKFSRTFLS